MTVYIIYNSVNTAEEIASVVKEMANIVYVGESIECNC